MRLALISDIHANRQALQACLDHARQQGADQFAFLGDLVGYGADPVAGFKPEVMPGILKGNAVRLLGLDKPQEA